MKLRFATIYLVACLLVSIDTGAKCNCKDTLYDLNVESIEIMSFSFDTHPRYSMEFSNLLPLREIQPGNKDAFYRLLNQPESAELEKKLSLHLKADTLGGVWDNNMDIRFLMIIHYTNAPPVFIGIEAFPSGTMFINGKRYRRDRDLLLQALPYMSNEPIRKSIIRNMKNWNAK